MVQIKSLNGDATKLILLAKDKYVLYDLQSSSIIKHFVKSKKQQSLPSFIDVSYDDKYSIEKSNEFPSSVLMRNLVNNTLVSKFEGHSQNVSSFSFVKK